MKLTRIFKPIALWLRLFAVFISGLLIVSCSECGYHDRKEELEALSSTEWSSIYSDLLKLYKTNVGYGIFHKEKRYLKIKVGEDPIELSEAEIVIVHRLNKMGISGVEFSGLGDMNSRMGGCFDDTLYLHVAGFNGKKAPHISISWGEHPIKEKTLWKYQQ